MLRGGGRQEPAGRARAGNHATANAPATMKRHMFAAPVEPAYNLTQLCLLCDRRCILSMGNNSETKVFCKQLHNSVSYLHRKPSTPFRFCFDIPERRNVVDAERIFATVTPELASWWINRGCCYRRKARPERSSLRLSAPAGSITVTRLAILPEVRMPVGLTLRHIPTGIVTLKNRSLGPVAKSADANNGPCRRCAVSG
jgi:hypothetical protein